MISATSRGDLGLVVELLDAFLRVGVRDVGRKLGGDNAGLDERDADAGQQFLAQRFAHPFMPHLVAA